MTSVLRRFTGLVGRRLGHLCRRLGLISFIVAMTGLFVVTIFFTSSTDPIVQTENNNDETRKIDQKIIISIFSKPAPNNTSKVVNNRQSSAGTKPRQVSSTKIITSTKDEKTTTSSSPPEVTPIEAEPVIAKVNFRLISYFDAPVKFLNIPKQVSDNLAPILPVNRYGNFSSTLRNRDLVILIPTIYRPKQSYLSQTIRNLLGSISDGEKSRIVILVSINEISTTSQNVIYATANALMKDFPEEIFEGLIEIIGAPPGFYMDFASIPDIQDPAIVDTPARLHWRSKQVIDYAFMFSYAFTQKMAKFVLLLEDDVAVTEAGVVSTMLQFPETIQKSDDPPALTLWYEFCPLGAIGKMFSAKQIPTFVNIMTTVFYVEPVDWQLGHIAELFACRYFHTKQQCDRARKQFFKIFPRKLFKHVAKVSTAPVQPARKIPKGQ